MEWTGVWKSRSSMDDAPEGSIPSTRPTGMQVVLRVQKALAERATGNTHVMTRSKRRSTAMKACEVILLLVLVVLPVQGQAQETAPLRWVHTIPLPQVEG